MKPRPEPTPPNRRREVYAYCATCQCDYGAAHLEHCDGGDWVVSDETLSSVTALVEAARRLHDECCTLRGGERLNLGPMLEPTESAVLEMRRALRTFDAEAGRDTQGE